MVARTPAFLSGRPDEADEVPDLEGWDANSVPDATVNRHHDRRDDGTSGPRPEAITPAAATAQSQLHRPW